MGQPLRALPSSVIRTSARSRAIVRRGSDHAPDARPSASAVPNLATNDSRSLAAQARASACAAVSPWIRSSNHSRRSRSSTSSMGGSGNSLASAPAARSTAPAARTGSKRCSAARFTDPMRASKSARCTGSAARSGWNRAAAISLARCTVAASTGHDGAKPRIANGHASLIPCLPRARFPRRCIRTHRQRDRRGVPCGRSSCRR